MHLPMLQKMLWGVTFAGELALCITLVAKRRWIIFPAFTTLMAYHVVAEAIYFGVDLHGSLSVQTMVYWTYVVGDFILQLAVVVELARIVLRPTGSWVRDAQTQFVSWSAGGCVVALICAWMVAPPTLTLAASLELRGNLFTSLLVLELFLAMSMAANRLGLGWRNHVMAIAQGLTFCQVISCIVDAMHNYLGEIRDYGSLDDVRSVANGLALLYWISQLWFPEPERQPISPELRKHILDLHDRVRLDLTRIS